MDFNRKRAGIVIAVVIVTTAFWVTASVWMNNVNRFEAWTLIAFTAALLALSASVMTLGLILSPIGRWLWVMMGGLMLSFLAIFGLSWLYLVGLLIVGYLWFGAARMGAREMSERRIIRISSTLSHSLPKVLLSIYILLSFAFYLTPASQSISELDATEAFQGQLDRVYETFLQSELAKIPASQRGQIKSEASAQVIQYLNGALNFRFCLSGICAPSVVELLPPLYAFLFFLLLQSVAFIFREIAALSGRAIFKVLLISGIVRIAKENAEVDVLRI